MFQLNEVTFQAWNLWVRFSRRMQNDVFGKVFQIETIGWTFNIDIKHGHILSQSHVLQTIVLGIHVSFRGCKPILYSYFELITIWWGIQVACGLFGKSHHFGKNSSIYSYFAGSFLMNVFESFQRIRPFLHGSFIAMQRFGWIYPPENQHDNGTPTLWVDVSPIKDMDFPASHSSGTSGL